MTITATDLIKAINVIDDAFSLREARTIDPVPVQRDNDAFGNAARALSSKGDFRRVRWSKAARLARKTLAFVAAD